MMAGEIGLKPLQVACELLLDGTVVATAAVVTEMHPLVAPTTPVLPNVPDMLKLPIKPRANCSRYDHLSGGRHAVQ